MLNNDNLLAKAKSETASRVAELETNLAHYTHLQEPTEHKLQTAACQKQDTHTHVSTISTQLDRLRSMQSPALTCNDLDDSTNDSHVVELEWARACMGIDNIHVLVNTGTHTCFNDKCVCVDVDNVCMLVHDKGMHMAVNNERAHCHTHSQEHVVHQ
jgi:hypothetical protein